MGKLIILMSVVFGLVAASFGEPALDLEAFRKELEEISDNESQRMIELARKNPDEAALECLRKRYARENYFCRMDYIIELLEGGKVPADPAADSATHCDYTAMEKTLSDADCLTYCNAPKGCDGE